ncbi:MAG: hypothetical protein GAK30_02191 [Paracidovorax wautersii]|uniref:CNNM transmembrane domain-containing protein n=1 Tax=Paracidovorax wautersii TaxID=1177982 RepID=A0A7V8FNF9_9BURK|nr:MAG: hypothetical protein GAK30_02191 [Paracidovorax wautersii]
MDVALLVFLTTLNGLFAMSEMALATSRKARLATLAELGDTKAQAAIRLIDQPTQFLSTIQIGITSIGMLSGIVGEAAFAGPLAVQMQAWGLGETAASWLSTGVVVTGITFSTIIFGELVPKRIGQMFPEPVARWISPGMSQLARLAKPAVSLPAPRPACSGCCASTAAPAAPSRTRRSPPAWLRGWTPASSSGTSTRWCATCSTSTTAR